METKERVVGGSEKQASNRPRTPAAAASADGPRQKGRRATFRRRVVRRNRRNICESIEELIRPYKRQSTPRVYDDMADCAGVRRIRVKQGFVPKSDLIP